MGDPYELIFSRNALGSEEIQLLLMYLYEEGICMGKDRTSLEKLLDGLYQYISDYVVDGLVRGILLSRLVAMEISLFCRTSAGTQPGEKLFTHVRETVKCMKYHFALCDMPLLLEVLAEYEEDEEERRRYAKQREALLMLEAKFGKGYVYRAEEIYIMLPRIAELGEFLRTGREEKRLSQEKTSEGVCAVESYSRIETGRVFPHRKRLRILLEKLDLGWGYFGGVIVTDKFEYLIRRIEADMALTHGKQREYMHFLDDMEGKLDMSIAQNRQYIAASRLALQIVVKEMYDEELLGKLWECLALTGAGLENVRFYSMGELAIFLSLARGYRRIEDKRWLAEKIILTVVSNENRKRFPDRNTIRYFERTLAGVYADMGLWEKEGKIAEKWLCAIFSEGSYTVLLEQFLDLLSESQYRQEQTSIHAKELLAAAVYMADLYECKENARLLKSGYERFYGKDVEWY